MAAERPELPARIAASKPDITKEKVLSDCSCYSPLALLTHLEVSSSDHKHVFKSLVLENGLFNNNNNNSNNTVQVEPMEMTEPVITTKSEKIRFICQFCHVWLQIHYTPNQTVCLDDNGHHFHAQGLQAYQCCTCDYSLSFEFQNPIISMNLFRRLQASRPKARSYADLMQSKEQIPTLASTYSTVLVYITDLLTGTKRNINIGNPHYLARIGLGDGSQTLLEELGFRLEENYLIAPTTLQEERLRQIREEIIVALDVLRQELGSTTIPFSNAEMNTRVKTADMQKVFGINPLLENRYVSNDEYINKAYATFGLTSGASDVLVSWAYKKMLSEPSILIDSYDAMDNLVIIANHTCSEVLETLVACERSEGKIGRNDISDAYAYFGVTPDTADDRLLIGLYQVKLSDEPMEKNTHQDKLKTIAIARNSLELIEFIKTEKGITSLSNVLGVPSHMLNIQRNIPVGLNNIGNTCYFNSVLQYYYTLMPFRETMLHNETYVEEENGEPKKIGGIEVDHSEIRRAKKFVDLLKELFVNLQQTQEKAISPQYDLAYMALLNEKDEEDMVQEEEEEVVQAVEDDKENHQVPDNDVYMKDLVVVGHPGKETGVNSTVPTMTVRPNSPPPAYNEIAPKHQEKPEASSSKAPIKVKERPSVDAMMFGKQQDVTECMGNVMYLVEAALKPLSKTQDGEQVDDMIRQLFYGKARQIISYCDNRTLQMEKKEMEEDFSHVIVDASEGKDLYDGLDEYFFADKLENFQGGHDATREVTVKSFPPVLQVLVQRVQFDRATANVYKSNAYIQFDKTIYLDRYMDANFEALKDRRVQVESWRKDLDKYKAQVAQFSKSEMCDMPIPNLLEAARQVLEKFEGDYSEQDRARYEAALELLKKEAQEKQQIMDDGAKHIDMLKEKIKNQYNDHTELEYKLHAVFIHQGQANYGHYWIYILDHKQDQWWKYNDSLVTKVKESEIFQDTTGSTANPYFLVYVDAAKIDDFVETIVINSSIVPSNNQ